MWRETPRHERNRRIYEEELDPFLPQRILDFHLHVFNEGVIPTGQALECGGWPITHYDFDDLRQDLADVYPGRETSAVCFGFPHVAYDLRCNNDYIAGGCDNRRFYGLRLFDPAQDSAATLRRDLEQGRFLGIKPYPVYARRADEADVEVPDMVPSWAMEVVDELGLLVMLHLPRRGRLADPLNQRQVVDLCARHPHARVVLAHVGRAYYLKGIVGHLERLRDLPNLYYDLAMLNHWEVLEYAFRELREDRLLFGSDIPIALAPGKSVEVNDQYTYVTPRPWSLSISDDHGKLVFTSFLYEELRAIRKAVERLGLTRAFVEGLFHGNGMALLDSVLSRSCPAAAGG